MQTFVWTAALAAGLPLAARAADADPDAGLRPAARGWEAGGSWEHREPDQGRRSADRIELTLRRRHERGSIAGQLLFERREARGAAFALDAYRHLWPRGYANVRALAALDGRHVERSDLYLELFQGFGRGLEASASGRLADYRVRRVPTAGIGLGAYPPRWYLRGQCLVAWPEEGAMATWVAMARRYFTDEDYFEARIDLGGPVDPGRRGDAAGRGAAVSGAVQAFPVARVGVALGAGWEMRGNRRDLLLRGGLVGRW